MLDVAAERLGISPTAVEKDYWASEILHVLSREFESDFIFKGGTSLSKGYRLVERFSEDIDILVVPGKRGGSATDTLMKAMANTAAIGVGGVAAGIDAERGRHRSYKITYPATREPTALIPTSVLLEMGTRGGPHPHESVPISSLLGDVLEAAGTDLDEFDDLKPFEVSVLHPGRTLLEKLVLIHTLTQQLTADTKRSIDRRTGRHFYDVYQLLGDRQVLDLLTDRDQTEQVLHSIKEIDQTYFKGGTDVRPAGGFATCPAFDSTSDISTQFQEAYEATMPDLYFGTSPLPTWEEICDRVAQQQALL